MKKYLVFTIRKFLGLDNDYDSLLTNRNQILEKMEQLEKIEIQNQKLILQGKKKNYYDYLTLKNLIWLLVLLGSRALTSLGMPPISGLLVRSITPSIANISSNSVEEIIILRDTTLKKMLNIIRK